MASLLLIAGCDAPAPLSDGGSLDAAATDGAALDASTPAPELPWLRDADGGVLILRGTNVSNDSKRPPEFTPDGYASADDFSRLREQLGMNAIRYLIFWEAVEPTQGTYDDGYLAEVRRRVEAAGAAGLSVVVDMHQDVFGRGFGFDGAPAWACDQALYDSFDMHRPAQWGLSYATPEVAACFDRFWSDPDLRASFRNAWRHVAEALHGANGVFAYEVINEPFWGSGSARRFEQTTLPSVYADCAAAIRAGDPGARVLIEPALSANIGLGSD